MKRKKKKEIIEQEKITDTTRGPEVWKEDKTDSTVGKAINDNIAPTNKMNHSKKIRYWLWKCEPAAP